MNWNLKYIQWKILWENKSPFERREPWFCFPALKWLNKLPKSHWDVLEFGCGGSTLYFSDNCKSVDSVEHDHGWLINVKNKVKRDNVTFYNYDNYPKDKKYDLILVDGEDRKYCFHKAKQMLKPHGLIIFDNLDTFDMNKSDFRVFRGYALDKAGITTTGLWKG